MNKDASTKTVLVINGNVRGQGYVSTDNNTPAILIKNALNHTGE